MLDLHLREFNISPPYVKDRIDSGEIKLVHIGTKDMIVDFYTKPLQGELFKYMRDKIMGITSMVNL